MARARLFGPRWSSSSVLIGMRDIIMFLCFWVLGVTLPTVARRLRMDRAGVRHALREQHGIDDRNEEKSCNAEDA